MQFKKGDILNSFCLTLTRLIYRYEKAQTVIILVSQHSFQQYAIGKQFFWLCCFLSAVTSHDMGLFTAGFFFLINLVQNNDLLLFQVIRYYFKILLPFFVSFWAPFHGRTNKTAESQHVDALNPYLLLTIVRSIRKTLAVNINLHVVLQNWRR